jgi:hypothetical protein
LSPKTELGDQAPKAIAMPIVYDRDAVLTIDQVALGLQVSVRTVLDSLLAHELLKEAVFA